MPKPPKLNIGAAKSPTPDPVGNTTFSHRKRSARHEGSSSARPAGEHSYWLADSVNRSIDLRFDCPPKVQTKVRTKWTKAAMPGPRNLHQNQAIVQLLARSHSAPPKSSRSRPTEYPWETRITPPPPRKKEANVDPSDEEAFQRIFRALRHEADRRYGAFKEEDELKNAKAREEAAAKRAAAAEAQRQADADTIAEAVQRALDKARLQPPKTATELATLEMEQGAKRAALEATATQLEASRDSTLKLKLGHAIARRNISTAALMRLWDANGDGDLTKEEFMQALKRTLKIEANIKEMSELFDSFDEDRGGSVTINELQPAVARIHEYCCDEALKEKLTKLKVAVYDLELAKLKDCLDVAQEWESILKQRSELKSRHTVVENLGMLLSEKVDRAKNKKFIKGSGNAVTPEYLAGELAGESGMVSRADFIKFAIRLKYASELKIEGSQTKVLEVLVNGFDTLLSRAGLDSRAANATTAMRSFASQAVLSKATGISLSMSHDEAFRLLDKDGGGSISANELKAILGTDGGKATATPDAAVSMSLDDIQSLVGMVDENGDGEMQLEEFEKFWQLFKALRKAGTGENVGPMMSAKTAVETLIRVGSEHADTERKLDEAEGKAMQKAGILQTAYVEEVTRKQAEFVCALADAKEKGKAKHSRIPQDWWMKMGQW